MGTFELVLLLIVAVLASSLISQLSSKISTPLVQIAIGVVIALFVGGGIQIDIDPELFLVLFIAPLLFNEANHIDKLGFWKNRGMILSLALGLVVATTLAVGFAMNALDPSLGLAAAFALGAALGPTDAVAVTSMAGNAELSSKQKSVLGGECLINDASGLVAFQFAIAAAVTGSFSLVDAGVEFLFSFFGGLAIGVVSGALLNAFLNFIRNIGLENRTFHVLFEVAVPFLVFLLAEHFGVSGVLAVVACGIVFSISYKQTGPQTSKMNIVSSSVWDVITFALNGIVFVLLGMMLPGGMMQELENETRTLNFDLLLLAVICTVVVIGVRFIWCMLMERFFGKEHAKVGCGLMKHSAVLAFAGAKGAITLSIAMTIPLAIASRHDLIFIASVAVLMTLVLANFLVPVLAPAPKEDEDKQKQIMKCYIKMLRGVVGKLTADAEDAVTDAEKMAFQSVIDEYTTLIMELQDKNDLEDGETESALSLRLAALGWQREYAKKLAEEGQVSDKVAQEFIEDVEEREERIEKASKIKWNIYRVGRKFRLVLRGASRALRASNLPIVSVKSNEYRKLQTRCQEFVLGKLSSYVKETEQWAPETVSALAGEYQKALLYGQTAPLSITQVIKSSNMSDEIRLKALHYEHALLDEAYSDKEIDRHSANVLRRQISAMQLDIADEI